MVLPEGRPLDRVVVVGACGAGKTTFARALANCLGAPFVELDALHHGPGWSIRPSFAEDVEIATRGPRWVADGNYSALRPMLWSRADAVVWLDLPLWLVEYQVIRRSLLRWIRRTELWNERGDRRECANWAAAAMSHGVVLPAACKSGHGHDRCTRWRWWLRNGWAHLRWRARSWSPPHRLEPQTRRELGRTRPGDSGRPSARSPRSTFSIRTPP